MKESARQARAATRESISEEYRAALVRFLSGAGESALQEGYEIGRRAAAEGISVLEMATLHHAALHSNLLGNLAPEELTRRLHAGGEFLAESLSPHEMASRGFREAILALRHSNEVLEQEIKRIAHALHDEAGQLLVAVHLALAQLEVDAPAHLQSRCREVTALLNQVEQGLRNLSHELRPTMLDDLGLVPTLEFLAHRVSERTGMGVHVRAALEGRLTSSVETALYRIVQEALNNAAKHSRAKNVDIDLRREAHSLRCSIRDDGVGFDVSAVTGRQGQRGLGLLGMEERLNAVGGALQIHSIPGRGTELLCSIPLEV